MSAALAQNNSLRAALFSFKGRLGRARFWEYVVLMNLISIVLVFVVAVLFFQIAELEKSNGSTGEHTLISAVIVTALFVVAFLWVSLALLWKRFHDRGRTGWFALISLIPLVGFLWIVVDAYILPGKAEPNRYGPAPSRPPRSGAAEIGFVSAGIILTIVLAFVGRTFIMEPFNIPSGSNVPTIVTGDYVAVSRYAYRLGEPARGDLVVFINPHTGEDYIKRIVGLPGDTVQVTHGIVSINGEPAERKRVEDYHEREWVGTFRRYEDTPRYRYTETLPNGRPHEILGTTTDVPDDVMPQDNTKPFKVPPGHFFAIGDNRDNSNDSRLSLGYVPLGNLVGRAEIIFFSRAPDTPAWKILLSNVAGARWERVFRVVN